MLSLLSLANKHGVYEVVRGEVGVCFLPASRQRVRDGTVEAVRKRKRGMGGHV